MDVLSALRAMSDEELTELLALRPDLAVPPPSDFEALARRAESWSSLRLCLLGLDRFAGEVLSALCLLPEGADVERLALLLGAPDACSPAEVAAAVARLADRALVVPDDGGGLQLVPLLATGLPAPAGLGPPLAQLLAVEAKATAERALRLMGLEARGRKSELVARLAAAVSDPARVATLLAEAPREVHPLIDDLNAAGPVCRVPGGVGWRGHGRTAGPVGWLVERCLLVPVTWDRAEMPREVGLALRGGRAFTEVHPNQPPVTTAVVAGFDGSAAHAGMEAVRVVETLLGAWGSEPPTALKDGGLGVRDLRRAAKAAEVDEETAALLIEVAHVGELVGVDFRSGRVLPSKGFDEWLDLDGPGRWLSLALAWLEAERYPSLAGKRSVKDKPIPSLHPGLAWETARPQRAAVAGALSELTEGVAPDAPSFARSLHWSAPALWSAGPAPHATLVAWVLGEAAVLGVTGQGALSSWGRHVLAGRPDDARGAAADGLGAPAATVTLQADLTAVAAGPVPASMAAELASMADVESRGAATVWRFSPGSVRQALDAGRTAEELLAFLEATASRGVPQPLAYLVADTARRHGGIRVGAGGSYARSDDTALVAELCRARRLAKLGLRAVAPTVAVSSAGTVELLAALRADGYLPMEEGPDGGVVVSRPVQHRLPDSRPSGPRPRPSPSPRSQAPTTPDARSAMVAALRAAPVPRGRPRNPQAGGRDRLADAEAFLAAGALRSGRQGQPWSDERRGADDPGSIRDLLVDASRDGFPVTVAYDDPRSYEEDDVFVLRLTSTAAHVQLVASGKQRLYDLERIEWVAEVDDELVGAW